MKHRFMMLIFGPKKLGNDIDIYLAPLIEYLKLLWKISVDVYDECREKTIHIESYLILNN